jgi:hypothetical protein
MAAPRLPATCFVILFRWFRLAVVPVMPGSVALGQTSYLDNGVIKIGVNLSMGGSITYLADSGTGQNIINSHDLGRQVQQSYYCGPDDFDPYANQNPNWSPWPWNPIQSGDSYGHHGTVLQWSNDGTEIYVKSRPMQWALNNVPGEATFESWIRLDGRAARVRARLTNARTDTTELFSARHQELPAVYTVGTLHRLFTYQGTAPWTNEALTDKGHVPPPWTYWRATENWAALVNDAGWGLGVYHHGDGLFVGGFYGTPGSGGPSDSQCGYISPLHSDHLDYNIVYEYEYCLILGWLSDIRTWIYQQPRSSGPDYEFRADRQHWHYQYTADGGFPVNGRVRVSLDSSNPQLFGPPCGFYAADVPTVYVCAAYHTVTSPTPTGELYWELNNAGTTEGVFPSTQRIQFITIPDGAFHTYAVNVASSPNYYGLITQLRFDPALGGGPGEYVDVLSISATRPPEIELGVASIVRSVPVGGVLPDDLFTVRNSGGGTVTYTISEDAAWLDVSPASGTNVGNADLIKVIYDVAGLAIGDYAASITVTDPNAVNSPAAVSVILHVVPTIAMRADFDGDGDVDQEDFGRFQACLSGSGEPYSPGCEDADLNGDDDVDQGDWAVFQSCMSGPGLSYRPDCG